MIKADRNGYYVVRDTLLDSLIAHDIAAWDNDHQSWTFCGDSTAHTNVDRWEVLMFICDPECTELRELNDEMGS